MLSQTVPQQSPAKLAKYISHIIVCDMSTEVIGSTERERGQLYMHGG